MFSVLVFLACFSSARVLPHRYRSVVYVGRILNMCFTHMRSPAPMSWRGRLLSCSHAQFSFRDCSISFRGGLFSLAFVLLGCHHIAIALWYIVGRILTMCFAHMRPPHPCREFSRLLFYFHAQFPLRDISISFQGGLFYLLFTLDAHAVVSPPTFLLPRPVFVPKLHDKLPRWAFSLAFHTLRPRCGFSHLFFYFHAQFSLCDYAICFQSSSAYTRSFHFTTLTIILKKASNKIRSFFILCYSVGSDPFNAIVAVDSTALNSANVASHEPVPLVGLYT